MKIEVHNILIDKAKFKKDGVYSYKDYVYLVKNNQFVAYSDPLGYTYAVHGVFHTGIGKISRNDRKRELKKYKLNLKQWNSN